MNYQCLAAAQTSNATACVDSASETMASAATATQSPTPRDPPKNTNRAQPVLAPDFFSLLAIMGFCLLYLFVLGFFLGLVPSDASIEAEILRHEDAVIRIILESTDSSVTNSSSFGVSSVQSAGRSRSSQQPSSSGYRSPGASIHRH